MSMNLIRIMFTAAVAVQFYCFSDVNATNTVCVGLGLIMTLDFETFNFFKLFVFMKCVAKQYFLIGIAPFLSLDLLR